MKAKKSKKVRTAKTATYKINGMHCAACEVLMKEQLSKLDQVKKVMADSGEQTVELTYTGTLPTTEDINGLINEFGYSVNTGQTSPSSQLSNIVISIIAASIILLGFILVERSFRELGSSPNAQYGNFLGFFLLGVVASVSSCAALIGGLVLALSRNWTVEHKSSLLPQLKFHSGRLLSFFVLGGLLGLIGGALQVSVEATALITLIVSSIMLVLGLQMLQIFPVINKIKLKFPVSLDQNLGANKKFGPFVIGFATFILPCGFTLSAQAQALSLGSFWESAGAMFAFALGTLPVLIVIGLSSQYFLLKKNVADIFLKTAGIVLIVFALYSISNQFTLLNLFPPATGVPEASAADLPEIVDGYQYASLTAADSGYRERTIVLRKDVPTKLTIFGQTYGCANSVVARDFWKGAIQVSKGQTKTIEFTPTKSGVFNGSCIMGMYKFNIQVI